MTEHITFFIYGLCVMFYSMMVWMFYRKNKEKLSRLITCLMAILDMECLKDLFLFVDGIGAHSNVWYLMNAIDMVIIPFYTFVLMELVKPGWLTWRKGIMHEAVFLLPLILYAFTRKIFWFDVLAGLGALYGTATYVLMFFLIARYQRQLKERFSYQENINLHWLRGILSSFFVILVVWTISCYMFDANIDNLYMLCSLIAWMVVSYFLYRHESVMDELQDAASPSGCEEHDAPVLEGEISKMVNKLFIEEKLFLNPRLKLSDVARLVGTNRTYLSRFFNQENGFTFYDYVNNLRIKYAENLLLTTQDSLVEIAEKSGFNSLSTFRRVFESLHHCTPNVFRNNSNS